MKITFKFEKDGDEIHAWCPELPGCHTHGRTKDEAIQNIREAAELYIESLLDESVLTAKTQKTKFA